MHITEKLDDSVTLPGTTGTNRKGVFQDERAIDKRYGVWHGKGPAWYQRDVEIPEAWEGKRITLLLVGSDRFQPTASLEWATLEKTL